MTMKTQWSKTYCFSEKWCKPMNYNLPGFPVLQHLWKLAQTHVHWLSDAIQPFILCCLLLLFPSIFPTIRVILNESLHQVAKYWSFIYSISPSTKYSGLISFRTDCVDLLAVQGTLKSLLQQNNWKVSIFLCLAFFPVEYSHLYMTIGKTRTLTIWIFVIKFMFLFFNMLPS